jgi:hypothetical protein
MAPRKAKPATAARATTAKPAAERRQTAAVEAVGSNSNRLLREAAWSRMFGRIESKNPFTR